MIVQTSITDKLTARFSPVHLEVINESNRHHVPPNSETHFKVVIASDAFDSLRLIARHRLVNELLADEFAAGLHALTMHTYTPEEWQALDAIPASPKCKG
ncbi:global transcriptional regulator BolA [Shewanella sp. NFH-SH190041]|uniref:BolA family protein n=1 Tax=Shewanella sp. NFH-SH190041 TaxID=2950245 RepID=UPI0021C457BC|nr:BolA/IbaG family iron-sulfur metabolism protein [Shewanella sp. NFH-SH190041]BDM63344.1 global transcriptional regulator BolA [Shewanella sp. NFH-SH190041]